MKYLKAKGRLLVSPEWQLLLISWLTSLTKGEQHLNKSEHLYCISLEKDSWDFKPFHSALGNTCRLAQSIQEVFSAPGSRNNPCFTSLLLRNPLGSKQRPWEMVAFDDSHLYLISKILNLISLLLSKDILLLGEQNLILRLELWSNFHSTKCLLDLQIS